MSDTEICFRAALHEQQLSTAAVLLAQLLATRCESQRRLTPAQDARLQQGCMDLVLARGTSIPASLLIEAAAEQYLPLPATSK